MTHRALAFLLLVSTAPAAAPRFHEDVAPILRDYCLGCHNRDDLDGDLSVETFADLMKGGESGTAITPGDAARSFLIRTVTKQEKPRMPPAKEPQPSAQDIALLKAWVQVGAPGPQPEADLSLRSTLIVPDLAAQPGVAQPIAALAWSPDGKSLAIARYGVIEIHDAANGQIQHRLDGETGKINSLRYSADGSRLLAASGITGLRGVATLWDPRQGKKIREFGDGSRDIFYAAELSPDGRLLAAAGYDRVVRVWELETGRALHAIDVHTGAIFDLAFSPDSQLLASASGDETVKIWRMSDGLRMDTLNQPTDVQSAVLFTPDGRFILAAGADNRIRLWRLISKDKPRINPLLHARFAHEDEVVRLALTPDGHRLVSASADGTLKIWTVPDLEVTHVIGDQPDLVQALAIAPDGSTVAVGRADGTLQRYPLDARPQPSPAPLAAAAPTEKTPSPAPAPQPAAPSSVNDAEPNNRPAQAQPLPLPAKIHGVIGARGDVDAYRFSARAGDAYLFEVKAAQTKSPLDSKLEILDAHGQPVPRVLLQAVRDSWFTFRGKDSDVSNDFRVQNWQEMDLNDYLYANGEVVRFWLYPRGPDSGFNVYPGTGKRHTFFDTTPLSHALGEPCYIVRPLPPGSDPIANGLPVFTLYYENDDDSERRLGKDSVLHFTAPTEGEYTLLLRDVTGAGGKDFTYELDARIPQPDFTLQASGLSGKMSPASRREVSFEIERRDGFEDTVELSVSGLPPGFSLRSPFTIEAQQTTAKAVLEIAADAPQPTAEQWNAVKVIATAQAGNRALKHELANLGKITWTSAPQLALEIVPDGSSGQPVQKPGQPLELTVHPGETISAIVRAHRQGNKAGQIAFGKEDAGRNLPFGVFVDNIGLSGLLILANQDERQFFITAGPNWLPETTRVFHLRSTAEDLQTTPPVILHIKKKPQVATR
ncbi:MAG: PD40 domain-containing protein [Verrucomicrobiales bacterium]|nr:PD40 domain-containing protein [Verrucomicrobiales bacterium]